MFEACIGLFMPAIATCRARYIADEIRGTVMGLLRYERVMAVVVLVRSYRGTRYLWYSVTFGEVVACSRF